MLLTITTNPSIDLVYKTGSFDLGTTNRELEHYQTIGGKGINAARVASILSEDKQAVAATGFLGRENANQIAHDLAQYNVKDEMIRVSGATRFCYTIIDNSGVKTELNELGQSISATKAEELLGQVSRHHNLKGVSINGSLAKDLSDDFYIRLIEQIRINNPDAKIILDTSGAALDSVLSSRAPPDYIKPNNDELGELLGIVVPEEDDAVLHALQQPIFQNIPNILVSMGSQGGIAKLGVDVPQYFKLKISQQKAVNTEGSGDATVGGMLYAVAKGKQGLDVIRYGMAAGMANVLQSKTGFVEKNAFLRFVTSGEAVIAQPIQAIPILGEN